MVFERLLEKVRYTDDMQTICELLRESIPHYDWVGFYMLENGELVLEKYSGSPTEHTRIPAGKGVCGQAVEKEKIMVIPDISKEDNYLSCSIDVKSEIVMPIFKDGEVVGELDIDSHRRDPFDQDDVDLLEAVCEHVAGLL